MRVCGFIYLSTHCHLLLRPESVKQLADFMRDVNSKIAREVGRLHDWKEKIWGAWPPVRVDPPEAGWQYLRGTSPRRALAGLRRGAGRISPTRRNRPTCRDPLPMRTPEHPLEGLEGISEGSAAPHTHDWQYLRGTSPRQYLASAVAKPKHIGAPLQTSSGCSFRSHVSTSTRSAFASEMSSSASASDTAPTRS